MAGAKQRLRQYVDLKGLSEYVFCKTNSLSNGYFNTGENVNSDKLNVIKSNYPDLNLSWVVTGEGSMLVDSSPCESTVVSSNVKKTQMAQEPKASDFLRRFEEIVAENALLKAKLEKYEGRD